jgi:hypothetical protein
MDYTELIKAVVALIAIVLTTFLVPWIKKNVSAATLASILKYVEIFVAAAEQIYDASQGAEKKAYVLQKLAEKNFHVNIDEIDDYIEAAVLKLHNQLKETTSEE